MAKNLARQTQKSLQTRRTIKTACSWLVAVGFLLGGLSPAVAGVGIRRSGSWLQIDAPNSVYAKPVSLWATYYYVHRAQNIPNGQPLLDLAGNPLGPGLSTRDWCYAALQGTVLVEDGRYRPITYNFSGRGASPQVDCSPFFSSLSGETLDKVNRVRFGVAMAPYGYGTGGFNLVPYRTIAVDRTQIPIGSVLFIPAARGMRIILPSGEPVVHDGYFFAADVGSAIHGNHIDVFVGTAERNPFPFIASRSSSTFEAFLVQDPNVTQALWALHHNR
jgi:3D (Asp-Asp-Asp) domain-containing protein